jgi:hypothetical protein
MSNPLKRYWQSSANTPPSLKFKYNDDLRKYYIKSDEEM